MRSDKEAMFDGVAAAGLGSLAVAAITVGATLWPEIARDALIAMVSICGTAIIVVTIWRVCVWVGRTLG